MTVSIKCGSCGADIEIPDDLQDNRGGNVQCPYCGKSTPLSVPVSTPPANAGPVVEAVVVPAEGQEQTKPCPFCGETILATALKCKHCREFLDGSQVSKKPPRSVAWMVVGILAAVFIVLIVVGAVIGTLSRHTVSANEASAVGALKQIVTAESRWRQNDTDRNGVWDYWTGDVSGLYRVCDGSGCVVGAIDIAVAKADWRPLPRNSDQKPPEIAMMVCSEPCPKSGYFFAVIKMDENGNPFQTDGPDADTNAWENLEGFAFCAFPKSYNSSGIDTFIVREDGIIWRKDLGSGKPVDRWPSRDPGSDGWNKADW